MKKDLNQITEDAAVKYLDAYRSQFQNNLALAQAVLAGAERMRSIQLAAARDAQASQGSIAKKITKDSSMQDLLTLQTSLLSNYCVDAMSYWTKVGEVVQQTQSEIAAMMEAQGKEALKQGFVTPPSSSAADSPDSLSAFMQSTFSAGQRANEMFIKALTGGGMPVATTKNQSKSGAASPSKA